MKTIIERYKNWKRENPEEDYQYDCITDFLDEFGRGDLRKIMEFAEKQWDKEAEQDETLRFLKSRFPKKNN